MQEKYSRQSKLSVVSALYVRGLSHDISLASTKKSVSSLVEDWLLLKTDL